MTNKELKTYNRIYKKLDTNEDFSNKELEFLHNKFPHIYHALTTDVQVTVKTNRQRAKDLIDRDQYVLDYSDVWKDTGSKLKNKRLEIGINQKRMAQETGYSASTIRKFENGEPVQHASKISRAYILTLELWDATNKYYNSLEELYDLKKMISQFANHTK